MRLSADTEKLVDLANASISLLEDLQPPPLAIFTLKLPLESRLSNTLISCIRQGDLSFVQSLLFAPAVHRLLWPLDTPCPCRPLSISPIPKDGVLCTTVLPFRGPQLAF